MIKIKWIIVFIAGALSVLVFLDLKKRIWGFFFEEENKLEKEFIITTPEDFALNVSSGFENGKRFFLPNSKKVEEINIPANIWLKTAIGMQNNESTCTIETDVGSNFGNKYTGKPHVARIIVSDFSSEASRIECSKIAMEEVLPVLLKGAFAGIVKAKIFEEGTIFKTFKREDVATSANANVSLMFDGGFTVESLNVGLLVTPSRFEVYITDCSNVKCGE